ncbi:hypothetical protein SCANM63S_07119 [Streptomyces canarius]
MFLDSSVRSTRTIVFRSAPISARSAAIRSSTSGSCARLRRKSASAPSPCTPIRVPEGIPGPSTAWQQSVNASAHRRVRNAARSAPRMPPSSSAAMSSGRSRK